MNRAGRWVRRIATVLGFLALAAVALWVWVVPPVAHRMIVEQFEAFGLRQPTFHVCGLSRSRAALTDLAVGEAERLRIGALTVDYGVSPLLRGEIGSVEVIGLEAEIRGTKGTWDMGPLADLRLPPGIEAGEALPFRRVDVRASSLTVVLDDRRLRVPFDGSLERAGPNALAVDLSVRLGRAVLRVTGTVSIRSGDFRLALAGTVPDLTGLLAAALPPTDVLRGTDWGNLTVEATLARDKGLMSLDATADGAGWRLSRLEVGETGLADWLSSKADRAEIRARWGAEVETPWHLLKVTPLGRWVEGRADAPAELSGSATLTLGRAGEGDKPGRTWSVAVSEVRAVLPPSDVAVPAAGAVLEGAGADLRLAASADADHLAVEVSAGSAVSAAKGTVESGGVRIDLAGGEQPGLAFRVNGDPVVASLSFAEDPLEWRITLPEGRLTLAGSRLSLAEDGVVVNGLAGALAFGADADPARAALTILPGSHIRMDSAVVAAGEEAVRLGAARFALAGRGGEPAVAARLEGDRLVSADGGLAAEADGPVPVSAGEDLEATLGTVRSTLEGTWDKDGGTVTAGSDVGGIEAHLRRKVGDTLVASHVPEATLHLEMQRKRPPGAEPAKPFTVDFVLDTPADGERVSVAAGATEAAGRVAARGSLTLAGALPHALDARVSLSDASVRHKEAGLALDGVTADVPVTWNAAAPASPGAFAVKAPAWNGNALPPLSGTVGVTDGRADFTANWAILKGARLRAEGTAGIGRRGPAARAYVSLPLFEVEDEEALGHLLPPLEDMLVGGSFALDGYVRVSPDGVKHSVAVTVLDGTFRSKAWETEAEGVYATVRINNLDPVLTPRQELQVALVRRARIGELEVSDGFVAFRLEPKDPDDGPAGWTAWVQRGEWGWAGGRLYVERFRYDPDAAEHTAVVHARDLDLRHLLGYIPRQQATGVGSLDGRLTVTVGEWPDLRFGEGELATPPDHGGWFKIANADALGDMLDRANPRFRTDELYAEIKDRLVNAFGNFEYDSLRIVFTEEDGRFVARVETSGRGRTGTRQEFGGITVNLWGFDSVLRDAILVGREALGR